MEAKYKSSLKQHILEILKDLHGNLSTQEFNPGKINIFGPNAWPIMTAGSGKVFLAAGELGTGRIIVAAHDKFGKNITARDKNQPYVANLQSNILSWLTKGKNPATDEIMELKELTQLSKIADGIKVIVYDGIFMNGDQRSAEKNLQEFLQKGGGFLHTVTPWGYLQIHKGKPDDILFHSLLKEAGLSYSEDSITNIPKVIETPATEEVARFVDEAIKENPFFDYKTHLENIAGDILQGVTKLPDPGAPGIVMAYSNDAYPLVLSKDKKTFIAASESGNGRIVAMSHNTYATGLLDGSAQDIQIKKLQENMIGWLSKDMVSSRQQFQETIVEITDDSSLKKITKATKVLIWNHVDIKLSAASERQISDFIQSGGGLLHAVTPWAYFSYSSQDSIPLSKILQQTGISYSDKYEVMYGTENGFAIQLNENYYNGLQQANLFQASLNEGKFLDSGLLLPHMKYLPIMVTSRPDFQDRLLHVYNNNFINFKNPTITDPISSNTDKTMVVLNDILSRQKVPGMEVAEGAKLFPGLPRISEEILEDLTKPKIVEMQLVAEKKDGFFCSGYYLPAGNTLVVQILSESYNKDLWSVKIGAHSDILYPDSQGELKRFPQVQISKVIDNKKVQIFSPYGGLVYFHKVESTEKAILGLSMSNVLPAPLYDLTRVDTLQNWDDVKVSASPWADVSGEHITITIPSTSVQDVADLSDVMRRWDRVVRLMHFLRGTDVKTARRQWIVTDAQPSAGYMHAGYPIVTHLDIADPTNSAFILGGNWSNFWGFYHELGHNFQRDAWNFTGTIEVTCNIFSMYLIDQLTGKSPMNGDWVAGQMENIKNSLKSGEYSFQEWQGDPALALGVYSQLCEYLGWECMCHVLRQYEAMNQETLPSGDQEKIDLWFTTYCEAAKCNLAPLFEFWEWPVSDKAKVLLDSAFKPFLPDDEITQTVPKKVDSIKAKFTGLVRKVEKEKFPYLFESSVKVVSTIDK